MAIEFILPRGKQKCEAKGAQIPKDKIHQPIMGLAKEGRNNEKS